MSVTDRKTELVLGGVYLLSGLTKLLPLPSIPTVPSLVEQFDEFAQHFPLGLHPPGWLFLTSIGLAELVGGCCLLTDTSLAVKKWAAVVMMMIMVGAWYTLYSVGEGPGMFFLPVVCFAALVYLLLSKYSSVEEREKDA